MNKAALFGLPLALGVSALICLWLYSVNGGLWNWWAFLAIAVVVWGFAISAALRTMADETTIEGRRK